MIRRALGEAEDPISRARLLGAYVEIVLAAGDTAAARVAADELRGVAAELGTPLLRAHAARGRRRGAAGRRRRQAALVELRRAFNEFNALGVRYDAARTRLLIAEACDALGDHDAAGWSSDAAHAALESLRGQVPRHRPARGRALRTASPSASSRCSSCSPRARRTG